MKRKKKVYTRRQLAFRRIGLALGIVLAVNYVCMFLFILPIQAVRYQEELYGVYDAKTIYWDWTPELEEVMDYDDVHFIYLTANDRALCYSEVKLPTLLYGWEASSDVVDCGTGQAFHGAYSTVASGRDWERQMVFYGRADDWRICRIALVVEELEGPDTWTLTVDDFIEKDGRRYFCERMDWVSQIEASAYHCTAVAYDMAGNVIGRQDVSH